MGVSACATARRWYSSAMFSRISEYGLVAPLQVSHLRAAIPCWLEDEENGLAGRFRKLLNGVWNDLLLLDQRVKELDQEIAAVAAADPITKRLQQLRGVGPMIATALLASVGDASQFTKVGRWQPRSG